MEQLKTCSKCKKLKPLDAFHKRSVALDGHTFQCKKCTKEYNESKRAYLRECNKEYRQKNKEKIAKKNARYYLEIKDNKRVVWYKEYSTKNRKKLLQCSREYYKNNSDKIKERDKKRRSENPEHYKEIQRKYREKHRRQKLEESRIYRKNNKDKIAAYQRKRINTDPVFKLKCRISTAVYQALVAKGSSKKGKSFFGCIGYTLHELKEHIESQFTSKMSWGNYGSYWQVHHRTPKGAFRYLSMDEDSFKECWSLDNLMPLETSENFRLGTIFRNMIHGEGNLKIGNPTGAKKSLLTLALEKSVRDAALSVKEAY